MTDLSKIPDLALRQKVKPLLEAIEHIDLKIEDVLTPIQAERDKLDKQVKALIGDRYIDCTCAVTGLPIFGDDDRVESVSLACVAA